MSQHKQRRGYAPAKGLEPPPQSGGKPATEAAALQGAKQWQRPVIEPVDYQTAIAALHQEGKSSHSS